MAYALAGKPYVDVLCTFAEAAAAVAGRNPFKQFPFVETPSGEVIYQTLAIMHHVGRGTPVWPDDPPALTRALEVGIAAYGLYQFFGAFAAGNVASFADCMAHEAVAWCVRRNEVCRGLFERSPALVAFNARFEQIPAIAALMARQAAARQADNSV